MLSKANLTATGVQTLPTLLPGDTTLEPGVLTIQAYETIKVTGKAGKATIRSAGQKKPVKLLKADALPGSNFTVHIISNFLVPPK